LGGGSGVARHGEDADLRTEGSGPGTEWEQRSTACARYVQLHPPRTVVDYYKGTVLLTSVTLDCSGGEYSEPLRLASCPRHRNRACSHPSASICVMRFSILPLRSRSKTSCFAAHAHLKKMLCPGRVRVYFELRMQVYVGFLLADALICRPRARVDSGRARLCRLPCSWDLEALRLLVCWCCTLQDVYFWGMPYDSSELVVVDCWGGHRNCTNAASG